MAIATPKVSLHLYLNNPYGLLSATIPHYDIDTPDKVRTKAAPSPHVGAVPKKYPAPLPGIHETPDGRGTVHEEHLNGMVPKLRFNFDYQDGKSTNSTMKFGYSPRITDPKEVGPGKETNSNHPRCISTSGQSCETNISGGSSSRLGFTWSLNVDKEKRRRKLAQPRPPPASILQKLGRHRNIEPVGIVRIKRPDYPHAHVTSYQVQKLALNDKAQRRVSEKLAEWLDEYNAVTYKQQEYLKKIHNLRRSLQHTDHKRIAVTIGKMRGTMDNREELDNTKHRRRYPVYTLTRLEDSHVNNGPSAFPNRPQMVVNTEERQQRAGIKLAPNSVPRKLAPIVKKIKNPRGPAFFQSPSESPTASYTSPRPEMTKMSTEYEPFESIARRNRLNLHQFLNPSIAIGQKSIGSRKPVQMSNVRIINEVAEASSENAKRYSPSETGPIYPFQNRSKVKENRPD